MSLRLFAKRDTLALLYHNTKTGLVIYPDLRAAPDAQQREIQTVFWQVYGQCAQAFSMAGVNEFGVGKDSFRFYGRYNQHQRR
jgi:hypothetical protein